ncbi:hypothetical protein GALMADRAFT_887158 [Galerina marginata CBS 339.88]|uniref:Uncharacterized protein n=1 Tax=Galerina marginata (strain CBS 339.88) TaxID=685588 RepID=A0A067SJC2_GALM3|nr:hypothetical protein GALMADRAFT_887158 [Galerina marginata CBS 339.88]
MSTSGSNPAHLLFSADAAWGHVRGFCILAARLVNENENIVITMFIAPKLLEKAHSEISTELGDGVREDILARIRILATFRSTSDNIVTLKIPATESYGPAYQNLVEAKSVTCAIKGTVFEAVTAPRVVLLDKWMGLPQLRATRAITGHSVPIVVWSTGNVSYTLRLLGPEHFSGLGDFSAASIRADSEDEEISRKIFSGAEETVIKIPGCPPLYDYELLPQEQRFGGALVKSSLRGAYTLMQECDGIILTTAYAIEDRSIHAAKSWFADWKKATYVLGPLLPLGYGAVPQSFRGNVDIATFLDRMLLEHGAHSVLFISFGTVFWPTVPEYIDELIEAAIEKKFPFVKPQFYRLITFQTGLLGFLLCVAFR